MSYIPLTDEKTRIIFGGETVSNLGSLDATQQEQVLSRLLSIVESEFSPTAFVHEPIANLDIITAGDKCRLYTKVVENIPRGDTEYHIVYVFYIDSDHDYHQKTLATYNPQAQNKMERITSLETVRDVEEYLTAQEALDADDLHDLLP